MKFLQHKQPTVDCNNCKHGKTAYYVEPCATCREWDNDDLSVRNMQWQPIIDWKAVAKRLWKERKTK